MDDAHQGLGIGTLLLEYLASEGRRNGLKRFAADTLLENNRMVQVFRDAGFTQRSTLESGVIRVVMDIAPTLRRSLRCTSGTAKRRHVRWPGLLRPHSIAVIGASRSPGTVGHELVRNLVSGGFQGAVYPVNPSAAHIASVPCFASIEDYPRGRRPSGGRRPGAAVPAVVEACGRKGVGGLVIVSSHFAEDGVAGRRS